MGSLRETIKNNGFIDLYHMCYKQHPSYHTDRTIIENSYDIIMEILKYANSDYDINIIESKYTIEIQLIFIDPKTRRKRVDESEIFMKKSDLGNKEIISSFISPFVFTISKLSYSELEDIIRNFNRDRNLSKVLD